MRFHVVALPHTQTTRAFSACAYTEKVRKFCNMMTDRGHHVTLYAGEHNEARVAEHVQCIPEVIRAWEVARTGRHYTEYPWSGPTWDAFNENAITAIRARIEPDDFICLIGGTAQKPIADAYPDNPVVEFGIGYGGSFAPYRVFESYAWMHTCYGALFANGNPHSLDGRWQDAVIPGYVDPEDFITRGGASENTKARQAAENESPYCLYVGRMIDRKGIQIAADACKAAGTRLVTAGPGTPPEGVEHVGVVGISDRNDLMQSAVAMLAPTIYVEPFGNVVIEALANNLPVITTDWGAFTETVRHGVDGFRCRNMAEFVEAIKTCRDTNFSVPSDAFERFGTDVTAERYEQYFTRILTNKRHGWYHVEN